MHFWIEVAWGGTITILLSGRLQILALPRDFGCLPNCSGEYATNTQARRMAPAKHLADTVCYELCVKPDEKTPW